MLIPWALQASGGTAAATPSPASIYQGKKIAWVDSYAPDYDWSQELEAGLASVLNPTGVEWQIFRLDMKRNPSEEYAVKKAAETAEKINAYAPDVIIATDDNAQQWLIVPYFATGTVPVVFASVNWDDSEYHFEPEHVTGMVEVHLVPQLMGQLDVLSQGSRVGIVAVDDITEQKNIEYYNRYFDRQLQIFWVEEKTQAEYQRLFLQAQAQTDVVLIGSNAGIGDWDEAAARAFFIQSTEKPTGSFLQWMAPYALITLAKSGQEEGSWAAETALRILQGTSVQEIPVTRNRTGRLWINLDIAEKLKVVFSPYVLKHAEVIDREAP
ncbi:MAG TPA: ABC transporter substrate binding protein [Anaerolineaceae bacterium]|nr:ABC transporter substrate binding protein [Anaerolineaceae bacterium]HPN50659.1 ABC transporter substrate binding protein [Anaerolineaceae bacterium]